MIKWLTWDEESTLHEPRNNSLFLITHTTKLYSFTKKTLSITFHFMSLQWKRNNSLNRAQGMNQLGAIHSACNCAQKIFVSEMVTSKLDYPQSKCCGCIRRHRTYCICTPGVIRCDECYAQHIFETETGVSDPLLKWVIWKTGPMGPFREGFT
jgi:hypothetical protein